MALPIAAFNIVEVSKPNIGERSPAMVRADVSVVLSVRDDIRKEWESELPNTILSSFLPFGIS